MSTPTRFSDGQYKNWLRSSQSLIIMKEALHDYIDKEVKKLHGDITLKVSSIPCSSASGNQCGSCSSKDIKLAGGRHGNWNINCKNSICDKWLHEILAVHDDPHNPTINWKNADISKFPTDCYHVAKIFMPKDQDKTTKMPDDLDAPAILSLMKYCTWFRKDLPNTQILSDLIDIRNKILHSGDLRVVDGDKDSWIDLMIQLLKDLKLHGDAQAKLETLKKEDIDINFRETEIRVLQKLVSSLAGDLTTVKGDIDSLQNSQLVLSKAMEDMWISATETTGKVDTVETDIEGMRKSLEELKIIYDKMVSFFDKNPGILDKDITESIRVIDLDVKDLQNNLFRVETELKASLEKHREETKEQIEQTRTQVEGIEKRVTAVEEQLSLQTETTGKKRPESEGLRQLKNQTEDKLDTLRKLECIPTKQAEKAKKLLEEKRSIVIKGNPGEGKTTTALHLIDNEMYRDRRVVLYNAHDWKTVDMHHVDIVMLDDVFGQYDFDPSRWQEWMVHLSTIQEHVDAGKLQVIVTSRIDILSKAYSKLGSLKLFSEDLSLTLSSQQLTNPEKMSILNRELHGHKRKMNKDDKEKCISNFSGLIGFPQCCSLFAGDSKLFDKGPEFFISPKKFFVANITALEATRFLSLAFLFCNGTICEENLSRETMPESSIYILIELASRLHISKKLASIELLRDAYDSFLELYVVKSKSYAYIWEPLDKKTRIMFTHATVSEAVGQVLGDRCLEMVVKYGDPEYLYQKTYTAKAKDSTSENVFLPVYVYGLLAERMVHDVAKRRLVSSVVKHSALKKHDFVIKLEDKLNKGNVMKDFFMAGQECIDEFDQDLSEGLCDTFMQYILQGDEDVVSLVYSRLLELLACAHNTVRPRYNALRYNANSDITRSRHGSRNFIYLRSHYNATRYNAVRFITRSGSMAPDYRVITGSYCNSISDCWQCGEKQNLLQLALYYHHFEIADKLITMKACYTPVSLCNAARHGDLRRVQTILETLKRSQVFNPECKEAKYALYRAYVSGNQTLIEFLLKEGIILDNWCVVHAVKQGDMNLLTNVVEHLKSYNKWNPDWEQKQSEFSEPLFHNKGSYAASLYLAYSSEKFDMADYLLKNQVKVTLYMLVDLLKYSSQKAAFRVLQDLKDAGTWDRHCYHASKALETAYSQNMSDMCNLLIQNGVSLKMNNLPCAVQGSEMSLESLKNTIQHLKDTDNWDPTCDDAYAALNTTICGEKYDVYDLLVQNGVSLKMKNLPCVIRGFKMPLEFVKKALQDWKDTDSWDPKCDDASKALETAICGEKYDVCDLLVQNGVSFKMKNLPFVIRGLKMSLEFVKNTIQHLKDNDNWDPTCDDAYAVLNTTICERKYDVCDLLVQNGVPLKMKNLPDVIRGFKMPLEFVKKALQNLKDSDNWDPKCDDASKALETAICGARYDVYDLLVQNGVSLKMKNLPGVIREFKISFEFVKKAIQHMKDTDHWDPKCDCANVALDAAICIEKYDVYDLLVQDGVSIKMKNLPGVIRGFKMSLEFVKKALQNLKDTDNWDPKCDDASVALEAAVCGEKYDICDLLVQDGVSLKMKNLPGVIQGLTMSLEPVKKAIQHLKDTDNWYPKCGYASEALKAAISIEKYNICDLLVQNGVSLNMKNLLVVIMGSEMSLESLKNTIQHLKDTDNWDPTCDDAYAALNTTICERKYDVCDLLVQNGVPLKMKNLPCVIKGFEMSLEFVKKAIQHWKDTDSWDPKCDDASKALEAAICRKKYDIYDLLVQNGVSLKMKNLPFVIRGFKISLEFVKKTIQHMKDTDIWDPKCDGASVALEAAICGEKYDICDLLVQEGVSLKMKNLPFVIKGFKISLEPVKKAIQYMKYTDNWDPKCDDASVALEAAICREKYDICDLLVQDGVSLKMKNLPGVIRGFKISLEPVKKAIQYMKDTDNWDPKCDDASVALEAAICIEKYDICDLLVQNGVSLNMKNLPGVIRGFKISLEPVKKAIQYMKDTDNWDPKCDDASVALEAAICIEKYDICDLLVQNGVSLKMKNLPGVIMEFRISLESVKKAIQHLKDTDNWDPTCDDASKALSSAYSVQNFDVCDLLVQEGV